MAKNRLVYCSCGEVIGEQYLDRIDEKLKSYGMDGGRVYKVRYNGKEARTPDGMLIPLCGRNSGRYLCKKCQEEGKTKWS